MSTEKLMALNALSDPDMVWSGSRLKLQSPPAPRPAARPARAAQKPKPKPRPQPQVAVATPATTRGASTRPAVSPVATTTTVPTSTVATSSPATVTAGAAPRTTTTTTTTAAASSSSAEPINGASRSTSNQPLDSRSSSPAATSPAAKTTPVTKTAVATRTAMGSSNAAKPAGADWRSYGPLQVDWASWQSMGGSFVAPTLNGDGQPLYLAINCGARKLNATSQSGQWKSWDAPQTDFEQKLVTDLCRAKGS